ncbi:hypothetical protein WA577_000822, partial [Blastocystis sp. JDR]
MEKMLPFYNTPAGKKVFDHFVDVNSRRFPEYMEELRGQADGADVPFPLVFMSTLSEEFSDYVSKEFAFTPVESCSDVIINEGQEVGICHNEDGSLIDFNRTSFLHQVITINNIVVSNFSSWCYAGQLPTAAFGFNSHIAMSVNYLHTAKGDFDGIARNFIARYLLDATSYEDAWRRITETPHCVGHNYQVMDLTSGKVVDIEVAPFDRIGRFTALPDHPHFHSNMYSLIIVDDTPSASSIHREARYKQLTPPRSFKEGMDVLSDVADKVEPIYRPTTLNTALYDFHARKCVLYIGPPSENVILAEY